jgi:hypothetical protein
MAKPWLEAHWDAPTGTAGFANEGMIVALELSTAAAGAEPNGMEMRVIHGSD